MAQEFKSYQNRKSDEDLLKLDWEEDPAPQADPAVPKKPKSRKKRPNKARYPLLIVLLLGVMGYSGYQIAATLIRNLKADNVYEGIANQYILENDATLPELTEPVQTKPSPAETTPGETRETQETEVPEQPQQTEETLETEATAPIYTVEADPETTAPKPTVPQTTAAPVDPMRILNVDFSNLKKTNSDTVAWIQGMGGIINYPVVQGTDNAYYLTHLFDGTKNGNGTVFVHCENKFLQDDVTFIFGHHMRTGKMFGRLTDYESANYYWNNTEFRLYTPGKIYTLKIYAVVRGTGTEQITLNYASAADFNRGMQAYASRSLHAASVQVSYGDKLVCLCTCSRHIDDGRFFIYCKVMNPG